VQNRRALISLVLIVCFLASGCAAIIVGAAAGGATYGYYKGILVDQLNADVPHSYEAAKKGLQDLKLPILKARYDQIKAGLKSELADGKNVSIKLKATEGGTTEIRIRIGTLGDKDASHRILRAVKSHL